MAIQIFEIFLDLEQEGQGHSILSSFEPWLVAITMQNFIKIGLAVQKL